MLIRQESIDAKGTIKDLPAASPLPTANLVLAFSSVKRFSEGKLQAFLKARYPTAQIIGCTTSGEINANGVFDDQHSNYRDYVGKSIATCCANQNVRHAELV